MAHHHRRLGGERVRPVCGLCGPVRLGGRGDRRPAEPGPRRGEPPSPIQAPERSSEASDALCDVYTSHATARRCPAAPGRAAACRARAACGAEPLYSPFWASKRESEPVAVLLILLVIVTTPCRTDTSQSIFGPPEFRVQARPRACGTVLPSPVPQPRFRDCAWVYKAVVKDAKAIREVR